jgi:hypothetical protein
VQVPGKNLRYCQRCFNTRPKCALCGLPKPTVQKAGDKYLCADCQKQAYRCSSCDQPIVGKYYTIEFLSGRYCATCFEKRPHCDFCGRPIVTGGKFFLDGRKCCTICASTSVNDMDQARKLLASTIRFLEVNLNITSRIPFDFALVDNKQMADLVKRQRTQEIKELGIYSPRLTSQNARPTIAVLQGLPEAAFLETAAHEYAHHWQIQNNRAMTDLRMIEGFATWVSTRWLIKNKFYSSSARIEKSTDPIYGGGFRIVNRYAEDKGAPALLRDILTFQNHGTAPGAPSTATLPVRNEAEKQAIFANSAQILPAPCTPEMYQEVVYIDPAQFRIQRTSAPSAPVAPSPRP